MIIELLVTVILPPLVYFAMDYVQHLLTLKKYPKGPFPLPIIGNLHMLSDKPYEDVNRYAQIYGDVFSMSFGMKRIVMVNSVEDAREMLLKKGPEFAGRNQNYITSIFSKDHLSVAFTDYGPYWKMLRKHFHTSMKYFGEGMKRIETMLAFEIDELHDVLLKSKGEPIDPEAEFGVVVVNIMCQITFGHRYKRGDDKLSHIINSNKLILQGFGQSTAVAFLPWLRIFPLKGLKTMRKGVDMRDSYLEKEVAEHINTFNPKNIRDFTDAMIEIINNEVHEEKPKTSERLITQRLEAAVSDFFSGGSETTLTTIRWFIIHMLHWPENQDKIYQEIINVIGENQHPNFDDREKLHFLNACIHESMRLSPIAPFIIRKTTVDSSLNNKNIPKDTEVSINHWTFELSEKYWEKPLKFNPNRWLDENGKFFKNTHKSFLPFSAGIRGCPGEFLAKIEIFLIISRLFAYFQVEYPVNEGLPGFETTLGFTLSPKPFNVVFIPRVKNCD